MLALPVAYAVLTARDRLVFARYAIPLVPFLCIGAALAVTSLADRVARARPRLRATALGLGALAIDGPVRAERLRGWTSC